MRETLHSRSPRPPRQTATLRAASAGVKGRALAARLAGRLAALLALGAAASPGCEAPASAISQPVEAEERPALTTPAEDPPAATSAAAQARRRDAAPAPRRRDEITLLAGGDVSFGRGLGQALLRDPGHDPFAGVAALLASADVRFVNLESQLSDQGGETQSPRMELVFTGPPAGADALARAGIDVVSAANNHMWDYGRSAFLETLAHLERAGVAYAGGGRSPGQARRAVVIERDGFRVALIAVTDVWNQGSLADHPGRYHVAAADPGLLAEAVRAARAAPGVDAVVVSYHGGGEYIEAPMPRARVVARAAIDAGADAFLGHHPHVVQGVEIRRGRPIFYSLGNLLMRPNERHPETALGALARLRLRRRAPPEIELCPVRIEGTGSAGDGPAGAGPRPASGEGIEAVPLARDPRRAETEAAFVERLRRVRAHVAAAPEIGPFGDDGCAPVRARAPRAR